MSLEEKVDELKDTYLLEKHRIDSFKTWPFAEKSKCSKFKMAQAGFYWNGSKHEPDTVTCFVCNKTLDGWEDTDEPWMEHAKHAPQCLFVKYGRPENEITVREFLEIFLIVAKNKILSEIEKAKKDLQENAKKQLEQFTDKKAG